MKKSLAPSIVTTRDPKGLKFASIVEAAYNKAGLSEDEAQRVNDTSGLADLIGNFIAENRLTDKFRDEEVESSYGYLSGYKPKGITEQTNRLRELFSGIGYAAEKNALGTLPTNAEGWFAIPRWEKIAPTYNKAVVMVLQKIKQTRDGKFYNYREGQLGPERLRQTARTAKFFQTLGDEQKDQDILVVPAQFGLWHRGRSVRRAREVMQVNEFGLGVFAIGIILLTHPERLNHYDDLYVDCAGDEFDDPGSVVRFDRAPCFYFDDFKVRFGTRCVVNTRAHFGSASGFLPQK